MIMIERCEQFEASCEGRKPAPVERVLYFDWRLKIKTTEEVHAETVAHWEATHCKAIKEVWPQRDCDEVGLFGGGR